MIARKVAMAQALRLVGGRTADAEDLVQTAMLRAWENRDRFVAGTNERAWFSRILHNCFVNQYRKGVREQGQDAWPEWARDRPVEGQEAREEAQVLLQAIDALPDHQKAVMVRIVDGEAYHEIAEDLGIPIGTVMSRVFRARGSLAANL